MGAPVLVGMGMGALTSLAMGKDPLMGAAVGGASGGMFGGTGGFGSGFGFDNMGFNLGSSVANTAATGVNAGTALGQGGMNTALGQGLLGATPTFASVGGSGILSSVPETSGGYSDLLGGDSILQNYDMGMNGVESQLNAFSPENIGSVTGTNVGIDYPDFSAPPSQSQSNGYVLSPDELETAANIKQFGGLETPVANETVANESLLDNLGLGFVKPYMPTERDIGQTALGMGINALTPEQQERLRHQQAMLMRGQTGNVLGQGGTSGIGGQYISRAR